MKKTLLFNELLTYFLIQFFGLICAKRILAIPIVSQQIQAQQISWLQIIITILIGALILLVVLKFIKHRAPYKIFFGFLFFLGTFYTLNIWLPFIFALILTIAIFIIQRQWPIIIFHNLIIVLTIVWAAVYLGLVITPWQMVLVLLVLSIYDIIAVWKTKHMIRMFKGLAERGVVFAVIIPTKIHNLFKPVPEVKPTGEFLFMGTGDFALPMIFAISALSKSIWSAILIICGALLGIIFIHFVFLIKKERKPLPALPPLAIGAILGWLAGGLI